MCTCFATLFIFHRELLLYYDTFLQRKVDKVQTGWKESRYISGLFDALMSGFMVLNCAVNRLWNIFKHAFYSKIVH